MTARATPQQPSPGRPLFTVEQIHAWALRNGVQRFSDAQTAMEDAATLNSLAAKAALADELCAALEEFRTHALFPVGYLIRGKEAFERANTLISAYRAASGGGEASAEGEART